MKEYVRKDVTLSEELFNETSTETKRIVYKNCTIESLHFSSAAGITRLQLTGCTVSNIVIEYSELENIRIENCSINTFTIVGDEMEIESVDLLETEVKYKIGYLTIKGGIVDQFKIDSIGARRLNVASCKFKQLESEYARLVNIRLNEVTITEAIRMYYVHVVDFMSITSSKMQYLTIHSQRVNDLLISATDITQDSEIGLTQSKTFKIINSAIKRSVISGSTYQTVDVINSSAEYLEIGMLSAQAVFVGSDSKWPIHRVKIDKMNMRDFPRNKDSQLRLFNIHTQELDMHSFENGGMLDVSDVEIKYCLLSSARLHKGIFSNVSIDKLEAFNSVVSESTFLNINWPNGYRIVDWDSDFQTLVDDGHIKKVTPAHRIKMYSRVVDTYCQLKNVCLRQNNKLGALRFQVHELNYTYKITRLRVFRNGIKSSWSNLGDGIILFTNWLFSDFGISWVKPLVWLLLSTLVFLVVLIYQYPLGIGVIWNPFHWDQHDPSAFKEGLKIFLRLLSPVRPETIQTAFMEKPVNIFGFADFAMRIFASYLIYNFLRGTRKFNFNI